MKRLRLRLGLAAERFAAVLFMALIGGAPPATATDAPSPGQELAERLRSAAPDKNSEIHGTLIIHRGKEFTRVPVVCRVTLNGATWETEYKTSATTNIGAELLVIVHSAGGPNEYLFARAPSPDAALPKASPQPPADADIPLASSDFSLTDLGLDFLHWPQQQRLRNETRLGQACYVLESRNSARHGIVRVLSYIDQETGGLLIATAYDADGRVVKEFSLHGSSFTKVNGQWRLEKMDIRNYKIHSQTELKFNINE